jgi:Uma2 family endonuclease
VRGVNFPAMALQTTKRLTYDDFLKLPDDGKRYEIIDGELYVNASPVPRHQRIVGRIYFALQAWFNAHGGGEAFVAPLDIRFDDYNVVEPDVIAIKADRLSIIGPKNLQGPPHLVVEVLSDGSRRADEIDKRKLYDRFGVDEYWIADPELELVKIYRRTAAGFERVAEIEADEGGTITTPLFPGFSLDVRDVFA